MAKKNTVPIDIQYQVKVGPTKDSRTYEYAHAGVMSAAKAEGVGPLELESNLLKVLVKEFKKHARKQRKKLDKQMKQERKSRK